MIQNIVVLSILFIALLFVIIFKRDSIDKSLNHLKEPRKKKMKEFVLKYNKVENENKQYDKDDKCEKNKKNWPFVLHVDILNMSKYFEIRVLPFLFHYWKWIAPEDSWKIVVTIDNQIDWLDNLKENTTNVYILERGVDIAKNHDESSYVYMPVHDLNSGFQINKQRWEFVNSKVPLQLFHSHWYHLWFKIFKDSSEIKLPTTTPTVSIIVSTWKRLRYLIRLLNCFYYQTFSEPMEIWITGDKCPEFEKLLESKQLETYKELMMKKGHFVNCTNLTQHGGSYGYACVTYNQTMLSGKYVMWVGDDDFIDDNHVENYVNSIKEKDCDWMIMPTMEHFDPNNLKIRHPEPLPYTGGNAEWIMKSSLLKCQPITNMCIGQDLNWAQELLHLNPKVDINKNTNPTYHMFRIGRINLDEEPGNFSYPLNVKF